MVTSCSRKSIWMSWMSKITFSVKMQCWWKFGKLLDFWFEAYLAESTGLPFFPCFTFSKHTTVVGCWHRPFPSDLLEDDSFGSSVSVLGGGKQLKLPWQLIQWSWGEQSNLISALSLNKSFVLIKCPPFPHNNSQHQGPDWATMQLMEQYIFLMVLGFLWEWEKGQVGE